MTEHPVFYVAIYIVILVTTYLFCRAMEKVFAAGMKRGTDLALKNISSATFYIDILINGKVSTFEIHLQPKEQAKKPDVKFKQ